MTAVPFAEALPLDAAALDLLTLLALIDLPGIRKRDWEDLAHASGVRDASGHALHRARFDATIEPLVAAGAVHQLGRGDAFSAHEAWIVPVLEASARRGRLATLATRMAARRMHFGPMGAYGRDGVGIVGDLRRAIALDDKPMIEQGLLRTGWSYVPFDWGKALGMALPTAWIERLGARADDYVSGVCHTGFTKLARVGDDVLAAGARAASPEARARAASVLALTGRIDEAEAALASHESEKSVWLAGARGFVAMARGDAQGARAAFAAGTAATRSKRAELPSYFVVFDLLLALTDDGVADIGEVRRRVEKAQRLLTEWPVAREALGALATFRATSRKAEPTGWQHPADGWIDRVVPALVDAWTESRPKDRDLEDLHERAEAQGYAWLAARVDDLVHRREAPPSLLALRGRRAAWELALDALEGATKGEAKPEKARAAKTASPGALWWTVDVSEWGGFRLSGHVVSERARAGKVIPLGRLREGSGFTQDDRDPRIIDALAAAREYREPVLELEKLELLVGHPRVRDAEGNHITVEKGEPRLHVEPTKRGARIGLSPSVFDDTGAAVVRRENTLELVLRTKLATRLLQVVGERGIDVPHDGLPRMREVIAKLSGALPVHAAHLFAREEAEGDARPHVQLFRAGAGLRARVRVVPGGTGAALRPGEPPDEIVVEGEGGLRRVKRDLRAEADLAAKLLERCPMLGSLPFDGDDRVARDLEVCLELLVSLQEAGALVEWPEGQALRVPAVKRAEQVKVRARGGASWLEIEGEVEVDEGRVLSMKELLASASRARGRFVPLGDDQFLALTEDLKNKLQALARAEVLASKGRLSGALLPALETWLEGLDVTWSAELERRRAALAEAARSNPPTPRALQAELRDYQRDGFLFLARRTDAGLGACLADDMGLGKTVQALALLLHRAARGPALVFAPTSVCRNWEDEAARFAPTLRVVPLASGDREAIVKGAEAGDVVLASYGLLVASGELLAQKRFATVVFDEAHALKNHVTQRWKAARALEVDVAVALSGTPVENRVSELHAVLDVVVPGMLGPKKAFEHAFSDAMSSGAGRGAAAALRQIVRPLVLRRTKSQVLEELPPKTEMTRVVDPTPEHRAFYEAARRRALERVESAQLGDGGHMQMEILAEITRLRRAAIDPRLVGGDAAPPGGKIDALVELVNELREEGHRALVFSQFLEVLDFAKARLAEAGVACRRLDGTMTPSARAAEVAAFQSGEGDVFLLSLKAGGVGMNLTGADFVVHLDPWWNPAVEDQATDRAHRIGQTRPVTIVRLVTGGTIEEKVLALHGAKRRLYDDVVGAADGAGALDVDALAALLRAR